MKKFIAIMLVCVMVAGCAMFAQAEELLPVTVFVNGEQIEFDVNPIIENGRTLVPVRYIFEALGATVDWIEETSTVVATKGDIEITLAIGSNEMTKNGEIIVLDVPAKEVDGRTLVPARAVSEGMNAKVEWIDELQQVIITTEETPVLEEKDEYNYTELSPNDAALLTNYYADVRYVFEQTDLPSLVFYSSAEIAEAINNKSDTIVSVIKDLWNQYYVGLAIQIQIDSEDTYIFDGSEELTEEILLEQYTELARGLKLTDEHIFDVTFEKTKGGKKIALITFKNTDTMLACKYIALVPVEDTIRYFTAESDLFLENQYMLCEITENNRGSIDVITTEKTDFLSGIDNVVDNNISPAAVTNKGTIEMN